MGHRVFRLDIPRNRSNIPFIFFSRNVWRFDSYLPILTIDESPFHATRLVITREMGGGRGMVENICR